MPATRAAPAEAAAPDADELETLGRVRALYRVMDTIEVRDSARRETHPDPRAPARARPPTRSQRAVERADAPLQRGAARRPPAALRPPPAAAARAST